MNVFFRIGWRCHAPRALLGAGAFLAAALEIVGGTGAAQESTRKPKPVRAESSAAIDPAFDAFHRKYDAAMRDYDDQRIRMTRTQSRDPEPPHPARRFLDEARALSAQDVGGAMGWILEHLRDAVDDPAQRATIAKETFARLVPKHADETAAMRAVDGIKAVAEDLGEESATEMARALYEASTIEEVKAEALFLRAWLRTQGGTSTDPARLEDATAIYEEILYTHPRTRAGREVSGYMIGPVEKELYRRERAWVDELTKLQAAGAPPSQWPPQPVHEMHLKYQPISAAMHHRAGEWVNKFYPAYQQVERQGVGLAYAWLVHRFGDMYADGRDGEWNALRLDLLTVLYRQFPTDPWIFDSVRKLLGSAEGLPLARLEPAMQILLEKNAEPRVHAAALFAIAQCVKSGGDAKSYQRALELFTRVRDEFPEDALRLSAEGGRSEVASFLPGAPAPTSTVRDAEGRLFGTENYRGRVLLLDFWNFDCAECLATVPARAELVKKLGDKPFSLVGIDVELTPPTEYHERLRKAGIFWRTASVDRGTPWVAEFGVRRQPTTVLVDKDGIIRGRDLPWPELVALAEKLVDEAQAAAAAGGAAAGDAPKKKE